MGLLDDAIREHLELKRSHGADPQEVARQEDEALGPIPGREAEEHDHDELDRVVEPRAAELELDEPPAPYEAPAAEAPDEPEPELPPHAAEEPDPAFDLQQPTVEFSVDDEHAEPEPPVADEPAEPADELEETPEFLQETPEHDRLWFEQKPPRDFDF